MSKTVRITLMVISCLSILSGIFLAWRGSAFSTYFSGIFIGVVLLGSLYFGLDKNKDGQESS
ncbi:MAG TPA: hypothetical protein VJ917_09440 [Saprospiraceae bacterium]|nr:hypothetical protein [Saprospiraceae bacterium]